MNKEKKIQLMDYTYISEFNSVVYKDVLLDSNISGALTFLGNCKDEYGEEVDINQFVYPMNNGRQTYALPVEYLSVLPVKPLVTEKISQRSKGYELISEVKLSGFSAIKRFDTFREFVDSFCSFEHSSPLDFKLWKIIVITAYIDRINVRVSSEPAFGKDSIFNITKDLCGDVGIVHNPTLAKIEWLLSNKIIITNEVASIKSEDRANLEIYYLTCGAFLNTYEKRSIANYKGSKNTNDISKLSNLVCYNNLDCYPKRRQEKYFDNVFQHAVLERMLPFKLKGKITERFGNTENPVKVVADNLSYYKDIVKHFRYLEARPYEDVKEFNNKHSSKFSDRYLRSWEAICRNISKYVVNDLEYEVMIDRLYKTHIEYKDMINPKQQGKINMFEVEEEEI